MTHERTKRSRSSIWRIGLCSTLALGGLGLLTVEATADALPAGYAYEMVSPLETAGQRVGMGAVSDDGEQVLLASPGGFPGTENLPKLGAYALASRTPIGWGSEAVTPPAADFPFLGITSLVDVSRDLRRSLWNVNLKEDKGTQNYTPLLRGADGSLIVAGPTLNDNSETSAIVGASGDLGAVVTQSTARPALTDGTTDTRTALQRSLLVSRRAPDGSLDVRQVAYRAGATMSPTCSVQLGGFNTTSRGSVSADGSKVFFSTAGLLTSCASGAARRVWAKIDDAEPIDLSESHCTTACGAAQRTLFEGASRDGSRVFFSTTQKLLDGDQDVSTTTDLYEYDFNASGSKLLPVTSSTDAAGAGVVRLVRLSDDGSYAYFVANGRPLAGTNSRGQTPQAGNQNLYSYHRAAGEPSGTFKFIAALDSADSNLWAGDNARSVQTSATGRFLLFQSAGNLASDKLPGDTHQDIFRYDSQTDELDRIWSADPVHNGAARTGDGLLPRGRGDSTQGGLQKNWDINRLISDDGSKVIFDTSERLSPDDASSGSDVYLWEAESGRIGMLSDGKDLQPVVAGAVSRSGDEMFFSTSSPLVKAHTSGAVAVYAVRKDGGFPDPPEPPTPCSGDPCQGGRGPVIDFFAPGSQSFSGGGNLIPPGGAPTAKIAVAKITTVRGTSTRLAVKTPGKGKLQTSGSGLTRASASAANAGTYRLTVKLTSRAKRTLARKGRLKVNVTVRFTPSEGTSSTVRVPVTFEAKKQHRRKSSSRTAGPATSLSSDPRKGR